MNRKGYVALENIAFVHLLALVVLAVFVLSLMSGHRDRDHQYRMERLKQANTQCEAP